jgi:hypothetical protein
LLQKLAEEVEEKKPTEKKKDEKKPDEKKPDKKPELASSGKPNPFAKKEDKGGVGENKDGEKETGEEPGTEGGEGAPEAGSPGEGIPEKGEKEKGGIPESKQAVPVPPPVDAAELNKKLFDFFSKTNTLGEVDVHAFAEQNSIPPDQVEAVIYHLCGDMMQLLRGGKSAGVDPSKMDPQQLEMGIQVESEHVDNPIIQKKIAMDHLVENPLYYTHLQEMEQTYQGAEQQEKTSALLFRTLKNRNAR